MEAGPRVERSRPPVAKSENAESLHDEPATRSHGATFRELRRVVGEAYADLRGLVTWRLAAALYAVLVAIHRLIASGFYDQFGVTPEEAGSGVAASALDAAAGAFVLLVLVPTLLLTLIVVAVALAGLEVVKRTVEVIRRQQKAVAINVVHRLAILAVIVVGVVLSRITGSWLPAVGGGLVVGLLLEIGESVPRISYPEAAVEVSSDSPRRKWFIPFSLAMAVALLVISFLQADRAGREVKRGNEVHGYPSAAISAQRATVTPLTDPSSNVIVELQRHCLMFLGQANGTVVLYDVDAQATVRLPAASVVITDASDRQVC